MSYFCSHSLRASPPWAPTGTPTRPGLPRAPHCGPFDGHSEAGPGIAPHLTGRLPCVPLPHMAPRNLQVGRLFLTLACWGGNGGKNEEEARNRPKSGGLAPDVGGGWTGGWEAVLFLAPAGGRGLGPLEATGGDALTYGKSFLSSRFIHGRKKNTNKIQTECGQTSLTPRLVFLAKRHWNISKRPFMSHAILGRQSTTFPSRTSKPFWCLNQQFLATISFD